MLKNLSAYQIRSQGHHLHHFVYVTQNIDDIGLKCYLHETINVNFENRPKAELQKGDAGFQLQCKSNKKINYEIQG